MSAPIRLNDAQHDAAFSLEPILCCACPGSGKTRVLVERVQHILKTRPHDQIVMTTFSKDASREMYDRIQRRCGSHVMRRVTIGTFHSLALKQLKTFHRVGRILGQMETDHLVRTALARAGSDIPFDDAAERIAMCKMDPAYARTDLEAAKVARAYQLLQDQRQTWDFTDLMVKCVELMEQGQLPPLPADHLLADEYQDIDRIQARWLYQHFLQGLVPCAVGDDDQSVYGFRRALGYAGMMEFAERAGARTVTLDVNYRSTASILDHSMRLIVNNPDRVTKNMQAARGTGLVPVVYDCADTIDQNEDLIACLDSICQDNPRPVLPEGVMPYRFTVRPGQAAVLARTNQYLTAVEIAFIERRIPYVRTGRGFITHEVVQTMISLLSSLDKGDEIGLEVGLRWAGAGEGLLHELSDAWHGINAVVEKADVETLPGGPVIREFVTAARGWRRKIVDQSKRSENIDGVIYGVAGWMTAVLSKTIGLPVDAVVIEPKAGVKRDIGRIETLRDMLVGRKGSLRYRLQSLRQDDEKEVPRVVLSTFHSSKGLEWENVFLIDVVEGVVPSIDRDLGGVDEAAAEMTALQQLREERRVFYVAMTRARDALHIFTSRKRGVSGFLEEAGLWIMGDDRGKSPTGTSA